MILCLKHKIGKENLVETEFAVPKIHNYMSDMFAKEVSDSNFNLAVIGKISIFQEITPNFTYSQKLYF